MKNSSVENRNHETDRHCKFLTNQTEFFSIVEQQTFNTLSVFLLNMKTTTIRVLVVLIIFNHPLSWSAGRYFNKDGEIIDNWWSDFTSKGFEERAKCMVDQYSKYKVDGEDGKAIQVNIVFNKHGSINIR